MKKRAIISWLAVTFVTITILSGLVAVYGYARPGFVLNLDKGADITSLNIYLDKEKLLPSGAGGLTYKTRTSVFKKQAKLTINGPYVSSESVDVKLSPFSISEKELKLRARGLEDIFNTVTGSKAQTDSLKTFDNEWVIGKGFLQNQSEGAAELIWYNAVMGAWELQTKAILETSEQIIIPDKVRKYFYAISED